MIEEKSIVIGLPMFLTVERNTIFEYVPQKNFYMCVISVIKTIYAKSIIIITRLSINFKKITEIQILIR